MGRSIKVLVLSFGLLLSMPTKGHLAHFQHSPARIQGPYTIESSKIVGLFIYPDQKQVDVVVANGKYETSVSAALAATGNTGDDTAVSGGSYSDKSRTRTYTVTVTTAGALGVAAVSWATDKGDDEGGPVVVPTSGPTSIGTKGITLTFGIGADSALTLGNKWTVTGQREFIAITALNQHVILRGTDFVGVATAAPGTESTLFAIVARKAYDALSSYLGWIGQVRALDEM